MSVVWSRARLTCKFITEGNLMGQATWLPKIFWIQGFGNCSFPFRLYLSHPTLTSPHPRSHPTSLNRAASILSHSKAEARLRRGFSAAAALPGRASGAGRRLRARGRCGRAFESTRISGGVELDKREDHQLELWPVQNTVTSQAEELS